MGDVTGAGLPVSTGEAMASAIVAGSSLGSVGDRHSCAALEDMAAGRSGVLEAVSRRMATRRAWLGGSIVVYYSALRDQGFGFGACLRVTRQLGE